MIPGRGCDRDEIASTRGALNCGVVLDGISAGVNPVDEKSIQVCTVRFAARDWNMACSTLVT